MYINDFNFNLIQWPDSHINNPNQYWEPSDQSNVIDSVAEELDWQQAIKEATSSSIGEVDAKADNTLFADPHPILEKADKLFKRVLYEAFLDRVCKARYEQIRNKVLIEHFNDFENEF